MPQVYDDLPLKKFYEMVANNCGYGIGVKTVERVIKGIYKVILQQLELKGRISLMYFGSFTIKDMKSGERLIYDFDQKKHVIKYIKPKKAIKFKASEFFEKVVNDNNFQYKNNRKVPTPKKKLNFVDMINKANERKEKNSH